MKFKVLFFCFFASLWTITSQSMADEDARFSISGYIKDAKTGEVLIFASVAIVEMNAGVSTNQYGYYSIKVPAGNYTVRYSYLGYETFDRKINLKASVTIDMELQPKSNTLKSVDINAQGQKSAVKSLEMRSSRLDIKQLKTIPG